jgi:hypothetical protein
MRVLNSSKRLLVKFGDYGIVYDGKLVGGCMHILWDPTSIMKSITMRWVEYDPRLFDIAMMSFDLIAHEVSGIYRIFHDCWSTVRVGIILSNDSMSINLVEAGFLSREDKDAY